MNALAKLHEKAGKARAQADDAERRAAEIAREQEERQRERERAFDEKLVAAYDAQRYEDELSAAYGPLKAALREEPWVQAAIGYLVASGRRTMAAQEANNARTRLGLPTIYEPAHRELDLLSAIREVLHEEVARRIEDERAALYEARCSAN